MLSDEKVRVTAGDEREQQNAVCLFVDVLAVAWEKNDGRSRVLFQEPDNVCLVIRCNQAATNKKEIYRVRRNNAKQVQAGSLRQVVGVEQNCEMLPACI